MSSDHQPLSERALVVSSLVFYVMMGGVGVWLVGLQDDLALRTVVFGVEDNTMTDTLWGAGTGLAVVALTWAVRNVGPVKRHIQQLKNMLGQPESLAIAALAVASGVGEEILFRGALQPMLGFWWTVILFGLLHGGTRKDMRFAVLFATAAGVLLGWLTVFTGNLLAPILCHVTINFFNLHLLSEVRPQEGP